MGVIPYLWDNAAKYWRPLNGAGNSGETIDPSVIPQATASTLGGVKSPNSTTSGRLARFSDTAGTIGQTSGIYEDGSGQVGIGTTSPSEKIHIYGSGLVRSKIESIDGQPQLELKAPTQDWFIQNDNLGNLKFYNLASQVYFSNAGNIVGNGIINMSGTGTSSFAGNVGIGTTSPAVSLDVNGALRAKTYTVATLPAASLGAGMMAYVSDAATAWASAAGGTVAGSGSNFSRVVSDGTNWKQM